MTDERANLLKLRDELITALYSGEQEIQTRTLDAMEKVVYRSAKEIQLALADVERRLSKPITTVKVVSRKGFC